MHGCSLLSALPAIAHEMAQRLDAADEQVSEEILRTVGNLARYALSAQSTPQVGLGLGHLVRVRVRVRVAALGPVDAAGMP